MASGHVSRVLAKTTLNQGQVAQINVSAPARTGLVSRVNVRAEPFPILSAYDAEVEALAPVNLVAGVESGVISSWEWEQVGGAPVALSISGGTATLVAPATYDGALISVRVRGHQLSPSQVSNWVVFNIAVRPQGSWVLTGAGWQPGAVGQIL